MNGEKKLLQILQKIAGIERRTDTRIRVGSSTDAWITDIISNTELQPKLQQFDRHRYPRSLDAGQKLPHRSMLRVRRRVQTRFVKLHRRQTTPGISDAASFLPESNATPTTRPFPSDGLDGTRPSVYSVPKPSAETMAHVFRARRTARWTQLRFTQTTSACDRHHDFHLLLLRSGIPIEFHTLAVLLSEPGEGGVFSFFSEFESAPGRESYKSSGNGSGLFDMLQVNSAEATGIRRR